MHLTRLSIGSTVVELYPDGLTRTILPGGAQVDARPQRNSEYLARAQALGYGSDVAAMSRDHEVCHSWLCHALGLPESPTLRGVASGQHWEHWRDEESLILAAQRMARLTGVDLVALAARA